MVGQLNGSRDEGLDVSPKGTALSLGTGHQPLLLQRVPTATPYSSSPSLDLVAHIGATHARIDIFRERKIFLRRSP